MLNKTTAAPKNRRPWSWYRVGAPEEHLSGLVLLRSSIRVGAPEEPGSVLLRSGLLRSRVGHSQERPSPTYLPVPPSAFPGLVHALVGIRCGLPGCCWCLRFARPCPGPMGRVGYVHVGLSDPSRRVRFWLCRLGGCARRLREALG